MHPGEEVASMLRGRLSGDEPVQERGRGRFGAEAIRPIKEIPDEDEDRMEDVYKV